MTHTIQDPIMSKIYALGLGEYLTHGELKSSDFEGALRQLPVSVLSSFVTEGGIRPVTFSSTFETLTPESADSVKSKLPTLFESQQGRVLAVNPQEFSTVTGQRIAVLFSGGPAAGGHNVVAGLFHVLGRGNTLLGVRSGPKGLLSGDIFDITADKIAYILNLGGFDFLGSDRTKIKTKEQYEQVRQVVKQFGLTGIVIVGGDDSNTNAAFLADFLSSEGCSVIGVPKTIDGDLQAGSLLPISFGFDTATKIYSELVGNILQDTPSSRKYWHFVKLMGRSASHVALEVALQTKPTFTLISEEIEAKGWTLDAIVTQLSTVILQRSARGVNYGVVIVPEGVIEFIPEFKLLISALNQLVSRYDHELRVLSVSEKLSFVMTHLSQESGRLFGSLPGYIQEQLLLDRDSHGNLQVSQIPTEQLLIDMVTVRLKELKSEPDEWGEWTSKEKDRINQFKFSTNAHFFGYEGRCGVPSPFDAAYTFNLGLVAGSLALGHHTGYMASVCDLESGGRAVGIPLSGLMAVESRNGEEALVIRKALVMMNSMAFMYFVSRREAWAKADLFCNPGPVQFWGPLCNRVPFSVALNHGFRLPEFNLGELMRIS